LRDGPPQAPFQLRPQVAGPGPVEIDKQVSRKIGLPIHSRLALSIQAF
jgi:hypothetical protein